MDSFSFHLEKCHRFFLFLSIQSGQWAPQAFDLMRLQRENCPIWQERNRICFFLIRRQRSLHIVLSDDRFSGQCFKSVVLVFQSSFLVTHYSSFSLQTCVLVSDSFVKVSEFGSCWYARTALRIVAEPFLKIAWVTFSLCPPLDRSTSRCDRKNAFDRVVEWSGVFHVVIP